jgi:hypothetical protein
MLALLADIKKKKKKTITLWTPHFFTYISTLAQNRVLQIKILKMESAQLTKIRVLITLWTPHFFTYISTRAQNRVSQIKILKMESAQLTKLGF